MSELMAGIHPTRMELLSLKGRQSLAVKGHGLLSEKMDALILEFFANLEDVKTTRTELSEMLTRAFNSLKETKMVLGAIKLKEISSIAPSLFKIEVETRNLMGVRVPVLHLDKKLAKTEKTPFYGFIDTPTMLDESVSLFQKILEKIVKYAEVIATLERLADEIISTKRRVNALNYVIIPRLETTINFIEQYLEERERESFIRMRHIKRLLEKKGVQDKTRKETDSILTS
jgi:V/A-type H+-transporting ATPase subunit D